MNAAASYVIGVLTWLKPSDEIGGMMLLPSRDDAIDRLALLFRALGSGGGGVGGGGTLSLVFFASNVALHPQKP